MFKIGEFSRLNWVSIRTLRHYEKMGLLQPETVDPETGYRYYSAGQIPRLNRIILLKESGFSLAEISAVIRSNLTAEQMMELLIAKKEQLIQEIRQEQLKIDRIEARLNVLREEETDMNYDIVIRPIQSTRVASLRDTIPNYGLQGPLWEELNQALKGQNIKIITPCFAMYHDPGYREDGVDIEVFETVTEFGTDTERVKFKTLDPVPEMACMVHQGPYEGLRAAYNAISRWIEENGYRMSGPNRELYLKGAWDEADPEKWITEVQIPVEKRA